MIKNLTSKNITKLTILSLLTLGIMFLIHRENIYTLTDASFDVINRTPHWRSHQSRLIGPIILKILTILKFSEVQSVHIYVTGMIFFNNFLFFAILSSLKNFGDKAIKFVILFNFGFLIFQDVWLFAWDFLEITFFILYGAIIFEKKYLKYIIFLNFLHIFNRESALIMSLFFIFFVYNQNNIGIRFKNVMLSALFFNLFFGLIYTTTIRNRLFIKQSSYTGGGQDLENNFLGGNLITPIYNYNSLYNGETFANLFILFSLFSLFFFIIKNFNIFNLNEKYFSLAIFLNIIPVFIVGIFTETRQYFPSIVLLTYLLFSLKKKLGNNFYSQE